MSGPTPSFIHYRVFDRRWAELGLGDVELAELQQVLAVNPLIGKVRRNSGGLRKFRFVPAGTGGKSGGYRVYYAPLPDAAGRIALVIVFAKSQASDIPLALARQLAAELSRLTLSWNDDGAS